MTGDKLASEPAETGHSEMVERVAIALWRAAGMRALGRARTASWDEWADEDKPKWRDLAQNAIFSMREPTAAMLGSLSQMPDGWRDNVKVIYQAMIDAALFGVPQYQVADDALEKLAKMKESSGQGT